MFSEKCQYLGEAEPIGPPKCFKFFSVRKDDQSPVKKIVSDHNFNFFCKQFY